MCYSLFSVTIQQLCPDFSKALGSKIPYLPVQTQNQYLSNTNTAHRQFSRSANDAGSYPATEFSDYQAEMAKKINHPLVVSNPLQILSNAGLDHPQRISFTTRLHDWRAHCFISHFIGGVLFWTLYVLHCSNPGHTVNHLKKKKRS